MLAIMVAGSLDGRAGWSINAGYDGDVASTDCGGGDASFKIISRHKLRWNRPGSGGMESCPVVPSYR